MSRKAPPAKELQEQTLLAGFSGSVRGPLGLGLLQVDLIIILSLSESSDFSAYISTQYS